MAMLKRPLPLRAIGFAYKFNEKLMNITIVKRLSLLRDIGFAGGFNEQLMKLTFFTRFLKTRLTKSFDL